LEANIQPLKIQFEESSEGLRSQTCRKAADSGLSSGEALRQARTLMNSELPNFTVLSTGMSKVCVRADSLSTVRSTTVGVSSICRVGAGAGAGAGARASLCARAGTGIIRPRQRIAANRRIRA
jgi:hypothetical protein